MNDVATMGHNQPPSRDMLIMEWNACREQMSTLKDKEQALRKQIISTEFIGAKAGTNRVALGNGYALKAVVKHNYKLTKNETVDPADYSHIMPALGALPADLVKRLVKWTPELHEPTYRELTEPEKAIVNTVLIITDGSSTLELEAPKPARA